MSPALFKSRLQKNTKRISCNLCVLESLELKNEPIKPTLERQFNVVVNTLRMNPEIHLTVRELSQNYSQHSTLIKNA